MQHNYNTNCKLELCPGSTGAGGPIENQGFIQGKAGTLDDITNVPAVILTCPGKNMEMAPPSCRASALHYKDYVDTSSTSLDISNKSLCGTPWPDCAKWFSIGECDQSHRWIKVHLCGKEWCQECGAKDSWIHKRRVARWMPKAFQMVGIGYFVIEWPLSSRDRLKTKEALSEMGKRVKGAMQSLGYGRGLRRWHYFGGKNIKYNPHINVLVDGKYLGKERLEAVKYYLRMVLDEPDLIINYSYRKSVAEKVHTLKYVTRATFLNIDWDEPLAYGLYNFQNQNYWGKWDQEPVWGLGGADEDLRTQEVVALESGFCPKCGGELSWGRKPVHVNYLHIFTRAGWLREVGAGYYELDDG